MVSPRVTPEQGVGIHENDPTQGPACAIAAGAGTVYGTTSSAWTGAPGNQQTGRSTACRMSERRGGNSGDRLWQMRNGYALGSREGLIEITERLQASTEHVVDQLRQRLRIGVQWNTQVTINDSAHTVTQAYCSALPVAYSDHLADLWKDFARLMLEASYEATICAGIGNALRTGSKGVFLTLLGGGASGNRTEWITASIKRALKLYRDSGVEIAIVSYGDSKPHVRRLVEGFS